MCNVMKKLVVTILALLAVAAGSEAFAQKNAGGQKPQGEKVRLTREQIVDIQCSKLIEELELDDATAAKFSVIFKDYKDQLFAVKQKYHPKKEVKADAESEEQAFARKTDAEIEKEILDKFAESREIIDVRESFYPKFKSILNPRQIVKVYRQEKNNHAGMKNEQMARGGMPGGPRPGFGGGQRPGYGGQRPW